MSVPIPFRTHTSESPRTSDSVSRTRCASMPFLRSSQHGPLLLACPLVSLCAPDDTPTDRMTGIRTTPRTVQLPPCSDSLCSFDVVGHRRQPIRRPSNNPALLHRRLPCRVPQHLCELLFTPPPPHDRTQPPHTKHIAHNVTRTTLSFDVPQKLQPNPFNVPAGAYRCTIPTNHSSPTGLPVWT